MKKSQSGFTITEFAIALLIIAILPAFAIPSFLNAKKKSKEAK